MSKMQVTLVQTNTVETKPDADKTDGDVLYRVKCDIEASEQITLQLFVYKLGTTEAADTFSHIAMPNDLAVYPEVRSEAVSGNFAFYRTNAVTIDFVAIAPALEFATIVRQRLASLVTAQPTVEASFQGKTTYTLTEA